MYISIYYQDSRIYGTAITWQSPRTTKAVRRAIQNSQESIAQLAKRYGLNPNTVAKCKNRDHFCDVPMAPKNRCSSVLSTEEAIIVVFRKHTLLPLDDCLSVLQSTIARLTRSSLHRCLQRHGISRLPRGKVISLAQSSSGSSRSGACTSTSSRWQHKQVNGSALLPLLVPASLLTRHDTRRKAKGLRRNYYAT